MRLSGRGILLLLAVVVVAFLGWLAFATGPTPPGELYIWSVDGNAPSRASHVRTPYENAGGSKLRGFKCTPGEEPEELEPWGFVLQREPGLRDKILQGVGMSPSSLKKKFRYQCTKRSVNTQAGLFWEYERGK